MPNSCLVVKCGSNACRDQMGFYRIPSIIDNSRRENDLAKERRTKWIEALRRADLTETKLKYGRICSKHFISGKPAKLKDINNPDWVPSLKLIPLGVPELQKGRLLPSTILPKNTNYTKNSHARRKKNSASPKVYHCNYSNAVEFTVDKVKDTLSEDVISEEFVNKSSHKDVHRAQCSYESEFKFQVDHHVLTAHFNAYTADLFDAIEEPERFQCVCCNFKSSYNWSLYEHCKQKHHGRIDQENVKAGSSFGVQSVVNYYHCTNCSFKSDSSLTLIKHFCEMDNVKAESPRSEKNANSSTTEHCDIKPQINSLETKPFHCATCSFRGSFKDDVQKHMLAEHAEKLFACGSCSFKTKHKGSLKTHVLRHAKSEDFDWITCTECSHRTKRNCEMKVHMLLKHAANKEINWFECSKCAYVQNQS